jgi:transaldolase
MDKNPLHRLYEFGQSVWLDQISRELLDSGALAKMVSDCEVSGVTSNPTIFDKAISGSADYDDFIREHLRQNAASDVDGLYEAVVVRDIRDAADVLRSVYDATDGADGYVSLEVSPHLARDTDGTIDEARRLRALVDRPNLLIKVPATAEGLPAISALLGEGINVNVTLMFSQQDYLNVADAYMSGLERLADSGGDVREVASVASFFVSRIDVAVDAMLPEASPLLGKAAIANTRLAYELFQAAFASERFERLAEKGARVQRFLCASTSTKDPEYRDVLYIEELIGPNTVNTMPLATIDAFRDHGHARVTITENVDEARAQTGFLAEEGIDIDEVCVQLQEEGVQKFADSFDSLMTTLAAKKEELAPTG